jgi:hypothetical protein
VGAQPLLRPGLALGKAQPRGAGELQSAHINTAEFIELAARYGGRHVAGRAETLIADHQDRMARGEDAASFDEWAPSGIGSAAEICEIFTRGSTSDARAMIH